MSGSEKGRISKYVFTFSDLMYNRKNWRDLNKDKTITRQEAEMEVFMVQQEAYNTYYVQKAIALIRKIQTESEVRDQWGNSEATHRYTTFSPSHNFPKLHITLKI